MIPLRLLPHTVTVTTPATITDVYGNTVLSYEAGTTRELRAYVQPQRGDEETVDRDAISRRYLMFTVDAVAALDRVTFDSRVYDVDGPAQAWDAPAGAHHHETLLSLVEG